MARIKYNYGDKIGDCIFINDEEDINNERYAKFLCQCGTQFKCRINSVKTGITKSCGCLYKTSRKTIRLVHGHATRNGETSEYNTWISMKNRCYNVKNKYYSHYGGRGVIICDRWIGVHGFENFIKDMGNKPSPEYSIDRICNDGNYEPSNCRWATQKQQNNNTRANVNISYMGETRTMKQWAEYLGIPYKRIHKRINYFGWTIKEALETPINRPNRYLYK